MKKRDHQCSILVALLLASASASIDASALGQGFYQYAKLIADDADVGDQLGVSVAIDGRLAVVGAWKENDATGAVYLFDAVTGQQLAKLTAPEEFADTLDEFGISVAIDGTMVIVGAHQDDAPNDGSGAAYLFEVRDPTDPIFHARLVASDADEGDAFGISVGISGNVAIIGAHSDSHAGDETGAAYLFDVYDGTEICKLTADDAAAGDEFGFAVAISGDTAIVGAHLDDDLGGESGSAYLFDVETCQQICKLTASDGDGGDDFGFSVAIDGDVAVIGAYREDELGENAGAAYVFDTVACMQICKLIADDGIDHDNFGISVAISDVPIGGKVILVGAYADDEPEASGSAHLFRVEASVCTAHCKITADDAGVEDVFGVAVAIDGERALVGTYLDDTCPDEPGCNSGSAYIFNHRAVDFDWNFIVGPPDLIWLLGHWGGCCDR